MQHDESDVPLHQMTASAIGNMPEKDLDAVKEMVIRGVMHADENLFAFKVCLSSTRPTRVTRHTHIYTDKTPALRKKLAVTNIMLNIVSNTRNWQLRTSCSTLYQASELEGRL